LSAINPLIFGQLLFLIPFKTSNLLPYTSTLIKIAFFLVLSIIDFKVTWFILSLDFMVMLGAHVECQFVNSKTEGDSLSLESTFISRFFSASQ
jgi:hypothetical protein